MSTYITQLEEILNNFNLASVKDAEALKVKFEAEMEKFQEIYAKIGKCKEELLEEQERERRSLDEKCRREFVLESLIPTDSSDLHQLICYQEQRYSYWSQGFHHADKTRMIGDDGGHVETLPRLEVRIEDMKNQLRLMENERRMEEEERKVQEEKRKVQEEERKVKEEEERRMREEKEADAAEDLKDWVSYWKCNWEDTKHGDSTDFFIPGVTSDVIYPEAYHNSPISAKAWHIVKNERESAKPAKFQSSLKD